MTKNVRSARPRALADREPEERESWPSLSQFAFALMIGAMIGTSIASCAGCLT